MMERIKVFNEYSEVNYFIKDVEEIRHGKFKDFFNAYDIAGNGRRPHDSVMMLYFKDGTTASFGKSWKVIFE